MESNAQSTETFVVEYSTTALSKCKGKCRQRIEKGELRLASIGETLHVLYWRHVGCLTPKVIENIRDITNIRGFSTLKQEDQDMITDVLKNYTPPTKTNKVSKTKISSKHEGDVDKGEEAPKKKRKKKSPIAVANEVISIVVDEKITSTTTTI